MFLSIPCNSQPTAGSITSGAAFPSFADMFNLNPASIPTVETPVGVEGVVSTSSSGSTQQPNFSILKGFNSFGAAASSNSDNTFYTYNLDQAFRGVNASATTISTQTAHDSVMPTVNLGSALALVFDSIKDTFVPSLGVNARYNKVIKNFELGLGLTLSFGHFTFGLSTISNKGDTATGIPTTNTTTYSFGFQFSPIHFDYTVLLYTTKDPTLSTLTLFSQPVTIYTASADLGIFHPTLGYRTAYNILGEKTTLTLLSLLVTITDHFALTVMSNYVPGSKSLGAQVFF